MGGGARLDDEDEDVDVVGPRLGAGPRARWAELGAGNWLRAGMRPLLDGREEGRGGGGIIEDAESAERERLGTLCDGFAA